MLILGILKNLRYKFQLKRDRFQAMAGLDFHVLSTLFFRGWGIVAGFATILLLPLCLNPVEQGYYFTFASVLTLQIFFELGLNQIVIQLVSHDVAHLKEGTDGRITGNAEYLGRLSSLARLLRRWYRMSALLFAIIGGTAGVIFFTLKGTEPISIWLGAWVLLVSATAINLWLSPGLAVMEGCGKVGQGDRLRLVQSIIGYAAFWAALVSGAGLWAACAVPLASAVCTAYWLRAHGNTMHWLINRIEDLTSQICWRSDVFPLQWRISISFASGYIIFNLFTPVVFSKFGAIEAGQLGMALTILSAVSVLGMSWINAKAPNFTAHIARGERYELDSLFKNLFKRSTVFITAISICVVVGAWCLNKLGLPLMQRIAPPSVLAILSVATISNSMVFAMATYMRAHKQEPMLTQSVVVGILIAGAVYIGSKYSVFTMMLMYVTICLFVSLPWTIWLFSKYKKLNENT